MNDLRERLENSPVHDFDYIVFNDMKYPKHLLEVEERQRSWFNERILRSIWSWIEKNKKLVMRLEPTGNAVYVYVLIEIAGLTLIERRVRLI